MPLRPAVPDDNRSIYQVFEQVLKIYCQNRPGKEWVKAGLYEILNESDRATTVTIENWDDTIVPGMKLSMSIVLKQQQKSSDLAEEDCPSCGARFKGYEKFKLKRVRWY